jgi:hypothetical protein
MVWGCAGQQGHEFCNGGVTGCSHHPQSPPFPQGPGWRCCPCVHVGAQRHHALRYMGPGAASGVCGGRSGCCSAGAPSCFFCLLVWVGPTHNGEGGGGGRTALPPLLPFSLWCVYVFGPSIGVQALLDDGPDRFTGVVPVAVVAAAAGVHGLLSALRAPNGRTTYSPVDVLRPPPPRVQGAPGGKVLPEPPPAVCTRTACSRLQVRLVAALRQPLLWWRSWRRLVLFFFFFPFSPGCNLAGGQEVFDALLFFFSFSPFFVLLGF